MRGWHMFFELQLVLHDHRLGVLGLIYYRLGHSYLVEYLGVLLIMRILLLELLSFVVAMTTSQGLVVIEFTLFMGRVHVAVT